MLYPAAHLFVFLALSCAPAAAEANPRFPQPAMEAPLKIVAAKPCAFSGQRLLLTGKIKKIISEHTFMLEDGGKLLVRTVEPISEQIGALRKGERISVSGVLVTVEREKPIFVVGRTDIAERLPPINRDCPCEQTF